MKKDNSLSVAGIFLILYILWYSFTRIMFLISGWLTYFSLYLYGILTIASSIALIVYCFTKQRKNVSKIAYTIGFTLLIISTIFQLLSSISGFNLLISCLTICAYTFFLLIKHKKNKTVSIVGRIIVTIAFLTMCIGAMGIVGYGNRGLSGTILIFLEVMPLLLIWNSETKVFTKKHTPKATTEIQNTSSLENDLMKLKRLYESGRITEEQYLRMKTNILNKL